MLPSTSPTQFRSDAVILAEELQNSADFSNWPRVPELEEFEAMDDHIVAAGYYGMEELNDYGAEPRTRANLQEFAIWKGWLGAPPPKNAGRQSASDRS